MSTTNKLAEALRLALNSHGLMMMSDPPQEAWKAWGVESKARAALAAHEAEAKAAPAEPVASTQPVAWRLLHADSPWRDDSLTVFPDKAARWKRQGFRVEPLVTMAQLAPTPSPAEPLALMSDKDIMQAAQAWREFDAPEGCGPVDAMVYGACRAVLNKYRDALAAAPAAPAPEADWTEPTPYRERFAHAVALLCGKPAPADMIDGWLARDADTDDHRLQDFAINHGPAWAQGIVLLDAALHMADNPTEGVEHGERAPAAPADHVLVPLAVLEDASTAIGHFVSDEGWGAEDMQAMDNLDAYIAQHRARAANKGGAA